MAHTGYIMTLANSIIGVGILAMPFCFQKCGIVLSIFLLILSNFITRISCHYLLKSSLLTRKRNFEFLALYAFGPSGKLMVELCIIGYLFGTCIAYFVVIGDLGPQIVAKLFNIIATESLRTWIMVVVTFLCIIPLGLLKNVDSLSAVCTASVGFYFCLAVKVMFEARTHLLTGDWMEHVDMWKPSGILQCLPIFSMALACQMQLFEVIESVNGAPLEKLNEIVRVSTGICTCVYVFVGFFGYIAFCTQKFSGNILMNFSPSFASDAIKIGFVISVAFSFPLAIFPCRASIYSLLYRRGHTDSTGYIPESRFKWITVSIVVMALIIGLLIPSIELVIGLVGSTIGIAICIMFPSSCYIKVFKKDSTEKMLAQFILVSGFCLMILGTFANLNAIDEKRSSGILVEELISPTPEILRKDLLMPREEFKAIMNTIPPKIITNQNKVDIKEHVIEERLDPMPKAPKEDLPGPELSKPTDFDKKAPVEKVEESKPLEAKQAEKPIEVQKEEPKQEPVTSESKKETDTKNEINKDAIKKEEEIVAEEEKKKENIEEIKQAKDELKQTKELLEKKVIELQQELAKQNLETQQLVEEKLGVIVDKVGEIERKVNLDTEDKSFDKKENNDEKKEMIKPQENLKEQSEAMSPMKDPVYKIVGAQPKQQEEIVVENIPLKQEDQIAAKGPILAVLTEKLKKSQETIPLAKHTHENNTVYEPMSYKVGEVMNKESQAAPDDTIKKSPPIPLPLFINATLHKKDESRDRETKKADDQEKTAAKDQPDKKPTKLKLDVEKPSELKTKDSAKDAERENIESIRRDILEVAQNREETTRLTQPSPNNLREKRNADSKDFCVNWDIEKQSCRDGNVNNELLSQNNPVLATGSDVKAQPFGRDLKSVNEDAE